MMRNRLEILSRHAVLVLTTALGLAAWAWPVADAVEPALRHAITPESLGLKAADVVFAAEDSTKVSGWWLQGPKDAPVVVIASRGTGTMGDMLPAAQQFLARGFSVLTFDYRGFGPGSNAAAVDSLRYIVFNSQWVEDMLGAMRYARSRGGSYVFVWGQDLGSAVAMAAAARDRTSCDALAIEGLFRSAQELLNVNGTAVMQDVVVRHRRLVAGRDEPVSAGSRLAVPVMVVLAGKDELTPPEVTRAILRRMRMPREFWEIPTAGHLGAEQTPGYFDRVTQWFKRWTAFPPAGGR